MDPWFSAQMSGVIGAVLGGGVGGILGGAIGGGVCGPLAQKGIARGFVMGYIAFLLALGAVSLVVGIVALSMGQPYHVWFPFTLVGVIMLSVLLCIRPVLKRQYQHAEQRRMDAESVRSA